VLQVITVILAILFAAYIVGVYRAWNKRTAKTDLQPEEQTRGVTAVAGFITVGVAAASILLAGSGVLLAFEPSQSQISSEAFSQLVIATVWLVVSLILGVLAAAWIVNHVHHDTSVAEHPLVMAASAGQLVALILGSIYFVVVFFFF
jgi:preprotein translocase subunit SecG